MNRCFRAGCVGAVAGLLAGACAPATDGAPIVSDAGAEVAETPADAGAGARRRSVGHAAWPRESDAGQGLGIDLPDTADASAGPCPVDMVTLPQVCMDRLEAPNLPGVSPLVMFNFDEAAAWCTSRYKRLCFDDEWTHACASAEDFAYPYGHSHVPGRCRDDASWRPYEQMLLDLYPSSASGAELTSFGQQLAVIQASGQAPTAQHLLYLYQAAPSGSHPGCTSSDGVQDLTGNVEEWTRRRDGGYLHFRGSLKGRYWAEARTCQSAVLVHGDGFRFYEIGFRCCRDRVEPAP